MAILRYGTTPWFGVQKQENEAFLVDSINYNVQTSSVDQTGNMGDVVGKIIYDQTVTFDMSGTLIYDSSTSSTSVTMPYVAGNTAELVNNAVYLPNAWNTGIKTLGDSVTSIIDTTSIQAQAGQATTLSISGTIYKFGSHTATE
jgi:hypothetical protein